MKLLIFLLHIIPIILGATAVVTTYAVYKILYFKWLLILTFVLLSFTLISVSYSLYYILIELSLYPIDQLIIMYRITQTLLGGFSFITGLALLLEFTGHKKIRNIKKIIGSAIVIYLITGVTGYMLENQFLKISTKVLFYIIFFNLTAILFMYRKELYREKYKKLYVMIFIISIYIIPINMLFFFYTEYSDIMNLEIPAVSIHGLLVYATVTIFNLKLIQKIFNNMKRYKSKLQPEFIEHFSISTRESEVMGFLIQGFTQKKIALEMSISPKTVANHIYRVYKKCDVKSLTMFKDTVNSKGKITYKSVHT